MQYFLFQLNTQTNWGANQIVAYEKESSLRNPYLQRFLPFSHETKRISADGFAIKATIWFASRQR